MTVQTCMAGRNLPIAEMLKRILADRGHSVDDASNPAECVRLYSRQHHGSCKLMVVEFTGPETVEMIDVSIERGRIAPQNILVLTTRGNAGAGEVRDFGCRLLEPPYSMRTIIDWIVDSEKRCKRRAA